MPGPARWMWERPSTRALPPPLPAAVPCKLFVLLEQPAGASGSRCQPCAQQWEEGQAAEPAAPLPPPGFSIKRDFKLAMRKGVHLTLALGPRGGGDGDAAAAGGEAADAQQAAQQTGQQAEDQSELGVRAESSMDISSICSECESEEEHAAQEQHGDPAAAAAAGGRTCYLCRTVLQGLHTGSSGTAASFDGL